jgi:hypothetical protein
MILIVCCENEDEARRIHPRIGLPSSFDENEMCWISKSGIKYGKYEEKECDYGYLDEWVYGKDIHTSLKVELLGTAKKGSKKDIVLASYNAG